MGSDIVIVHPSHLDLGPFLTASYLSSQGVEVSCIGIVGYEDGRINNSEKVLGKLDEEIEKRDPQIVAISNMYLPNNFIEEQKEKGYKTLLAGYDAPARANHICKSDEPIDMIVLGTPHEIPKLLYYIQREEKLAKEKMDECKNILFKEGRKIISSAEYVCRKECFLPEEIRSDIDFVSISNDGSRKKYMPNIAPILDMYGCDYRKCIFCIENSAKKDPVRFDRDERKELLKK